MSDPKPRGEITIPISPTHEVSDEVLFESSDGSQFFYLPRYRIAEVVVSGKKRLRIQVNNDEANQGLTIFLEKYPAPELGDRTRSAQELPHQTQVSLHYDEQKELVFQNSYLQGDVLRNELLLESSSKLIELINVITNASYKSKLLIRRSFSVAKPVLHPKIAALEAMDEENIAGEIHCLQMRVENLQFDLMHNNDDVIKENLTRLQSDTYQRRGKFIDPVFPAFPDPLQFDDSGDLIINESSRYFWPPAEAEFSTVGNEWFRYNRRDLEYINKTITGSSNLLKNRLQDLIKSTEQEIEYLIRRRVKIQNRRMNLDYGSIPDDLVAGRKSYEEILLKMKSNLNTIDERDREGLKLWIRYVESVSNLYEKWINYFNNPVFVATNDILFQEIAPNPFVFPKDIYGYIFRDVDDQGTGLIQYQVAWNGISYSYYQEEERPNVFRYLPHNFKLTSLPEAPDIPHLSLQFVWQQNATQPSGVQLTYRAVPCVDTTRRAAEAEQLRQQTHQEPSFEPLTSPSKLRIAIPAGWSTEEQPHIKEPIDLRQGFEDTVTLTWEGFRQVYNSLFGHSSLLKGEVIAQVNSQQQELIPFIARVDDFVGMGTAPPEPSVLLQRLLNSQVAPKIERTIQVTTYPFMFNPPPDRPNDSVLGILVDFFERGDKISLTPDKLSVKVTLRLSVSDYVLSKSDEGDYRYQVTLIYSSGQQVKKPEETGSDDNLYITLET